MVPEVSVKPARRLLNGRLNLDKIGHTPNPQQKNLRPISQSQDEFKNEEKTKVGVHVGASATIRYSSESVGKLKVNNEVVKGGGAQLEELGGGVHAELGLFIKINEGLEMLISGDVQLIPLSDTSMYHTARIALYVPSLCGSPFDVGGYLGAGGITKKIGAFCAGECAENHPELAEERDIAFGQKSANFGSEQTVGFGFISTGGFLGVRVGEHAYITTTLGLNVQFSTTDAKYIGITDTVGGEITNTNVGLEFLMGFAYRS